MKFSFSACTDVGRKRAANEDFYALEEKLGLFVVADGLGGHVAGRRASELGVGVFVETLSSDPAGQAPEVLRGGFARAGEAILEASRVDVALRGMGTTLAALWLRGGEAWLAHAGDSRIYLLREHRLYGLTLDHSVVGERVARGELSPEQARIHPGRHVITRAVGVVTGVEPDVSALRVRPDDLFVLCSDGISSQLNDDEIQHCIEKRRADLGSAAVDLVALANARGGDDNATVILVQIDP
ncbi:MAG: protein phosphatase 2C domain-containing protein [Myxococcota bacterium]